jgi:hypothetical protein
MKRITKKTIRHLLTITTLAFIMGFTAYKAVDVKAVEDWTGVRKEPAISCSPNELISPGPSLYQENRKVVSGKGHKQTKQHHPANKDSNGCSHQAGVGTLCEMLGYKRRVFKIHSC